MNKLPERLSYGQNLLDQPHIEYNVPTPPMSSISHAEHLIFDSLLAHKLSEPALEKAPDTMKFYCKC